MVRQKDRRGTHPANQPRHKSVRDFAREQGIPDEPADYAALATAVWPTQKDVDDFDKWLSEIRHKGISSDVNE